MFVPGAVAFAGAVYAANQGKMPATPPLWMLLGILASQVVASVGAVYLVGRLRHGYSWVDLGLRRLPPVWAAIATGLGIACVPLLGWIAVLVMLAKGQKPENVQAPFLAPGGLFSWQGAVGMTLLAGMLVPLAEEFLFRGVLFRWLRRHWSFWPSATVSALIFGVFHSDLAIGTAVILLGIAAAWVYERSGSLWAPVLVHVVNNSVKIVALYTMLALGLDPNNL